MVDFASRLQEEILKDFNRTVEQKIDSMVNNRQMTNDDSNWHRGYIAALREKARFISKELTQKMNEG